MMTFGQCFITFYASFKKLWSNMKSFCEKKKLTSLVPKFTITENSIWNIFLGIQFLFDDQFLSILWDLKGKFYSSCDIIFFLISKIARFYFFLPKSIIKAKSYQNRFKFQVKIGHVGNNYNVHKKKELIKTLMWMYTVHSSLVSIQSVLTSKMVEIKTSFKIHVLLIG